MFEVLPDARPKSKIKSDGWSMLMRSSKVGARRSCATKSRLFVLVSVPFDPTCLLVMGVAVATVAKRAVARMLMECILGSESRMDIFCWIVMVDEKD